MTRSASTMLRPLGAAALLAGTEVALVLGGAAELFLTDGERWRYAVASVSVAVCLSVLLWAVGSAVAHWAGAVGPAADGRALRHSARRVALIAATACAPLGAVVLWSLTEGRRVRDLPARPVLVVVAAALLAGLFGWFLTYVTRRVRNPSSRSWAATLALAAVCVAAQIADVTLLRRLYPAFHWALWGTSLAAALLAALLAPSVRRPLGRPGAYAVWALGLGSFVALPAAVHFVRAAPNASFVVESRAPITGKLVGAFRHLGASDGLLTSGDGSGGDERSPTKLPGIDLRDRDVLLITVDALRADCVRAFGGDGVTPNIDRLAEQSRAFRRAYTPTPHTSYALSSLLTGKYLRPVLQLPEAPSDHPALPRLLRRYGYRTAAFYPPSVFYVDGHRFEHLQRHGLGFEYRKRMYATAGQRVEQLERYLAQVEPGHPLFVWVHLFEPHEPYNPPPRYRRGDSARERYEGEVRVVDEAIAELVEAFRSQRSDPTVILTADHGEEFGDHGGHYHGTTLYDEQVRVPLLWHSPGVVEPGVDDTPVEIIDVTTTVLAAAGVPRDPRMRGDDLGPVLAGHPQAGPKYAFAGIGDMRMITDGRYKAICTAGEPTCRLYDLVDDPAERINLAPRQPRRTQQMRQELARFVGSIPRVEAMAMADGAGWPEPLARAELGDPTAAPQVIPLLGDERSEVRAAAARVLAALDHASALPTLGRLRDGDPDERVRVEAAVAALELGDGDALGQVRRLLRGRRPADGGVGSLALRRRAARALARAGDDAGVPELIALAEDETASERARRSAIEALAELGARRAVPALVRILDEIRLRADAARALGRIGDRRAARAIAEALEQERFVPARTAEAEALAQLGHPRTVALVRRLLGTDTSLPGGVGVLLELGALRRPSGEGADLRQGRSVRRGGWECDEDGCRPGEDAAVVLPAAGAPRGPVRAVFRVTAPADEDAALHVESQRRLLQPGMQEVSIALQAQRGSRTVPVSVEGDARLIAVAVVPQTEDVEPPAPQRWDAGAPPPDGRDDAPTVEAPSP